MLPLKMRRDGALGTDGVHGRALVSRVRQNRTSTVGILGAVTPLLRQAASETNPPPGTRPFSVEIGA